MPVQYDGLIKEHERVRHRAGLFDVSHMGELLFRGSGALATLNHLATNDIASLEDGQVLYTPLCNVSGGVRDDVLVYRLGAEEYMMVVNAANSEKIRAWCQEHLQPNTEMQDRTMELALLALQGPESAAILRRSKLLGALADGIEALEYYRFLRGSGDLFVVSRTGYTGERGYEIYLQAEKSADLWEELLRLGKDAGLGPAGLGARDTLRFEVGYCLYGNELAEDISPLEAGLGWTVKWKKGDFLGREALQRQKERGLPRRLVGLEIQDRVIARSGFEVRHEAERVGMVTSGTFSPTRGKSLAMALVDQGAIEQPLKLVVRGREVPVQRCPLPFYESKSNA
jgi:aminomethyltransferase